MNGAASKLRRAAVSAFCFGLPVSIFKLNSPVKPGQLTPNFVCREGASVALEKTYLLQPFDKGKSLATRAKAGGLLSKDRVPCCDGGTSVTAEFGNQLRCDGLHVAGQLRNFKLIIAVVS